MTQLTYTVKRYNQILSELNASITPEHPPIVYSDDFKQSYIDCLNNLNTTLDADYMNKNHLIYISYIYDYFYSKDPNTATEKFTNLVRFAENKVFDFYGLDNLYYISVSIDNIDKLYVTNVPHPVSLDQYLSFTAYMLEKQSICQSDIDELDSNLRDELTTYYHQNPELFNTLLDNVFIHGYDYEDCFQMLVTVVQATPYFA